MKDFYKTVEFEITERQEFNEGTYSVFGKGAGIFKGSCKFGNVFASEGGEAAKLVRQLIDRNVPFLQ